MIEFLRMLYITNKRWFLIASLMVTIFAIAGCSSGAAPPVGPIGGGCG